MRKHPMVEFSKYTLLLLILILTENPISIIVFFIFTFIISKGRFWLFNLWTILAIVCIDSFSNFDGVTYLAYHNYHIITLEAITYGLFSGLRVCSIFQLCWKFSQDVDSEKLTIVTQYFSPNLALLVSMTVRNVKRYTSKFKEVLMYRKAGLEKKNPVTKFIEVLSSISIVIDWALENGFETTFSMLVRGFGKGKRTAYKVISFTKLDFIEIVVLFCCIIGYILTLPKVYYFPKVEFETSHVNLLILVILSLYCLKENYIEDKIKKDNL